MFRKALSVTLAFLMLLVSMSSSVMAFTMPASSVETFDSLKTDEMNEEAKDGHADDDDVRIIVQLEGKAAIEMAESVKSAEKYEEKILAEQNKAIKKIEGSTKAELKNVEHFTLLMNAFCFDGKASDIDTINAMSGMIAFADPEYELIEPQMSTSTGATGATEAWDLGITGEGMTVAIVDTGIRLTHEAFSVAPENPKYDQNGIAELVAANASNLHAGTNASSLYKSSKIPFAYDYAYSDYDPNHTASDHGTHVAGIAAGNNGSDFKGVAYNAQIFVMQVFSSSGGASYSTTAKAVEDCAYLGVDAVNMSLGSTSGFTSYAYISSWAILQNVERAGILVAAAAGNDGSMSTGNRFGGYQISTNPDNGVVGTPSVYAACLSIASSNNSTSKDPTMSSFSSRGTTADLKIKPELTAPGGNITSSIGFSTDTSYATWSGTSMATPHVAGGMTLVKSVLREKMPNASDYELATITNDILMGTAKPLSTALVTAQGAGFMDLESAISTSMYMTVNDGRPKLEIDDSEDCTWSYTVELTNFGDTDITYTPSHKFYIEKPITVTSSGTTYYKTNGTPLDVTSLVTIQGESTVTVPAGETVSVSFSIDASAVRSTYQTQFPVGTRLEGFLKFTSDDEEQSVPILGYLGDWDEPSIFDRGFYWQTMTGELNLGTNASLSQNIVKVYKNSSTLIGLGFNPYVSATNIGKFNSDWGAISPNSDGKMESVYNVCFGVMRNLKSFKAVRVTPSGTTTISTSTYYQKNSYPNTASSYSYKTISLNYKGADLKEGETAYIKLTGYLDHDGYTVEGNEMGEWVIPVTKDTKAPLVYIDNGKIAVYDEHYVAYTAVYADAECTELLDSKAYYGDERGETSYLEGYEGTVYVLAGDYASNDRVYEVNLETGEVTSDSTEHMLVYKVEDKIVSQKRIAEGDATYTIPDPEVEGRVFAAWDKEIPETMPDHDLVVNAIFEDSEFLVKFVDYDGTVISQQTVVFGNAAVAPEDPYHDGMTFLGWDTDFTNVSSNLIVTAQYDMYDYRTVTFVDWDGTELKSQLVRIGSDAEAPDVPERASYVFIGWDVDFTNVQDNIIVTAQYEPIQCTVTFVGWDGAVLKTQVVLYGESAEAPEAPEREGYIFSGWDVDFTNVQSDLTVTAVYTIKTYTVKFLNWDGSTLNTQTVNHGSAATAPTNPTRLGYTFTGWDKDFSVITEDMTVTALFEHTHWVITFLNASGGVHEYREVPFGEMFDTANLPSNPTKTGYTFVSWDNDFQEPITEDITVTPIFEINEYTVTFVSWDGTVLKTQVVLYGEAAEAPEAPEREGYDFSGWDVDFTSVQSDLTVTAVYTIKTYTVKFLNWDGSTLKTQTVNHGSAATAPTNPTRLGYTFTGWDKDFSVITEDMTVTALFEHTHWVITFLNASGGVHAYREVLFGEMFDTANLPSNPTKTNYTFVSWDNDFQEPITEDITVTPIFELNKYTVTIDPRNGDPVTKVIVEHGSSVTAPTAIPTHPDGKTFKGWYYHGEEYNFNNAVVCAMTISAIYEEGVIYINSFNELNTLVRLDLSAHYVLRADISSTSNFLPIGKYGDTTTIYPFTGTFDGLNHSVNLNMSYSSADYVGMFAKNEGTIKNIQFYSTTSSQVYGNEYVGAIAGNNCSSGKITHCIVYTQYALTIRGYRFVGSVVGCNDGLVEYSKASTTKSRPIAANYYCGGIVGLNDTGAVLRYCDSYSDPCGFASGQSIGGIAGGNRNATIYECGVRGYIGYGQNSTTVKIVGGVVGQLAGGTVKDCYVSAHQDEHGGVEGYGYVGGLIGYAASGAVENCYVDVNIGYIDITYVNFGIGYNKSNATTSTNSYVYKGTEEYSNLNGIPSTWDELKQLASTWDWENVWNDTTEPFSLRKTYYTYSETHTVTFLGNNGEVLATETVNHGDAVQAPTAPYCQGYEFEKWDSDISCVIDDMEVRAIYKAHEIQPTDMKIMVGSGEGRVGGTVKVYVSVENAEGLSSAKFEVLYNNELMKLEGVVPMAGGGMTVQYHPQGNYVKVTLSGSDEDGHSFSFDGNILELTFSISNTATVCTTPLSLSISDIQGENEAMYAYGVDGSIDILKKNTGDVSGDGELDMRDAILLLRYLSGWDIDIDPSAADINGDGETNMLDIILIMRYLAGWDIPYFND